LDGADRAGAVGAISRPLHLLTTDILLADLVSGRTITTDEGLRLALPTTMARGVLAWYRANRGKWAGNVMTQDCEAVIKAAAMTPAVVPAPQGTASSTSRVLRLARVVAHRFAGIHAFGTVDDPPGKFIFEPSRPITLFEGWNGSGKTSLANAIIWCLTGRLIRPQRLPEGGDKEFACEIERDDGGTSSHSISSVTPLPAGMRTMPEANASAVPADTWVELTFVDAHGTELPPIRRVQSRNTRGRLVEDAPDLASLGLDPIAFTLGTTMPSMLPYLQVGSQSDLGQAVARLTGLADLVDLARHAARAKARIEGAIADQRRDELISIDADYVRHRDDLAARVTEFSAMMPPCDTPLAADAAAASGLAELARHFERLRADGLAGARQVLGEGFDATDPTQRADLEGCVGPAIEQLRRLRQLPSMERLAALKVESDVRAGVDTLLELLAEEAKTLDELAADPVLERRVQLYARVMDWMHEHGHAHDEKCAVCRKALEGTVDPETGKAVVDHLRQVAARSAFLSQTIRQWAEAWTGRLARDLPLMIRQELERDLPAAPAELLRAALTSDLFATEPFSGVLAALEAETRTLVVAALTDVPAFMEPAPITLPERVAGAAPRLATTLRRLARALAFVDWMAHNRPALLQALDAVRSGSADFGQGAGLYDRLARLELIVNGVAPITAAGELVARLSDSLAARTRKVKAIADCATAADALAAIVPIGDLATAQVEGLRNRLHGRAAHWRNAIYQNATTFSPQPHSTGMTAHGVIDIRVGRHGVSAPAQHVSNASALRAGLLGFYLAFREHVIQTSGGLALVVLDDPQDLLDYDNRQRLARAIDDLAAGGAQIIATTHDRSFGRIVVAEARGNDRVEHRSIHPVNTSRRTIETSLAVEDLDRKRADFVSNQDSASHAQDYANQARIFLEARLGDLFDDPAYPAYSAPSGAPTLMPLVDRLRGLVSGRSNELFRSPVLARFCDDPALADGAQARRVLNQAHHRDRDALSYVDVERIDVDLKRLRVQVERVHEEFRRFRWREPLEERRPNNVVPLAPVIAPSFAVPIVQDIAAFSSHMPSGGNQDDTFELLSGDWFDDKAFFYIRHDTLGFAIPPGSVAIVEAAPSAARDHDLVIARRGRQAFARRLLRPRNGEGFSLAAEATDPRAGRPTLAFEDHALLTHRIVGAIFSHLPPPEGREEAAQIDSDPTLARVEIAYRVREESAVPRAMPGQIILCGPILLVESLNVMEGAMVAVTLEDGDSILKRVGAPLSQATPYLRQFDAIGALGASVVIATERVDGAPNLPIMLNARPVLAVLY
jgi:hypothetical protein